MITRQLLIDSHTCSADMADKWLNALNATCDRFEINTPQRVAGFLSQIAHESGGFKFVVENLNYSAPALRTVFGKYFTDDSQANAYARQPERIANKVYANRMGNGDEAGGEGYKYRGRGLIQLTGKDNYTAFGNACGIDAVGHPEIVESPDAAALSAGWFWDTRHLNALADMGNVVGITKRINGGVNGLDDRQNRYAKIIEQI